MTAQCWKRITVVVSIIHIATMLAFVAMIWGASRTVWQSARPLAYAGAAFAWLAFFASERYRVALRREWPHPGDCRCSRCLLLPWRAR
jgi:hypothetical protein